MLEEGISQRRQGRIGGGELMEGRYIGNVTVHEDYREEQCEMRKLIFTGVIAF